MEYTIKVLNLERRSDRRQAFIDHHTNLGYDEELIDFHHGHDAADYETKADIVKAMNEKYPIGEIIHFKKGDYGCFWSLSEMVESIANNESDSEYVLYTLDDFFLTMHADRLNRIFDYFYNKDKSFCYLKLKWSFEKLPPKTYQVEGFNFCDGLYGYGDTTILLNKRSARIILDESLRQKCFIEHVCNDWQGPSQEGFYTNADSNRESTSRKMYNGEVMAAPHNPWSPQDRVNLNED